MKLPQKSSFAPETCEIGPKVWFLASGLSPEAGRTLRAVLVQRPPSRLKHKYDPNTENQGQLLERQSGCNKSRYSLTRDTVRYLYRVLIQILKGQYGAPHPRVPPGRQLISKMINLFSRTDDFIKNDKFI